MVYKHKSKSVLENASRRIKFSGTLRYKTDHQISARRPDVVLINEKKKGHFIDFAVLSNQRVKIKTAKRLKNTWISPENCKSGGRFNGDTNVNWCLWNAPQENKIGSTGDQTKNQDQSALLKSVWILRRVLGIWGDLLSLELQ